MRNGFKEPRKGYVPLARRFFDHSFWAEKREFSRAEAWLDLIAAARFEAGQAERLIQGKLIKWERGEVPISVRYLKERWGWGSKNKVARFLQLLENEGMIARRVDQGQTVVRLCQYEDYNPAGPFSGRDRDGQGTHPGHKKVEEKEPQEGSIPKQAVGPHAQVLEGLKERKVAFRAEVERAGGRYEKALRESFLAYWGETDRAGRMRFEREPTWETALRLFRWAQRERSSSAEVDQGGPKRLSRVMFQRGGAVERDDS